MHVLLFFSSRASQTATLRGAGCWATGGSPRLSTEASRSKGSLSGNLVGYMVQFHVVSWFQGDLRLHWLSFQHPCVFCQIPCWHVHGFHCVKVLLSTYLVPPVDPPRLVRANKVERSLHRRGPEDPHTKEPGRWPPESS